MYMVSMTTDFDVLDRLSPCILINPKWAIGGFISASRPSS